MRDINARRWLAEETLVVAVELARAFISNLERCAGSINPFYEHSFFRCSQSKLLLVLKRNHGREGTEMMMQG